MSLFNLLKESWDSQKFVSSWIVGTNNLENALFDLKNFVHKNLFSDQSNLLIENNPDFRVIRREVNSAGDLAKFISVDQIREVQKFLSTTASLSKYKVVVIYEADLMNLNASNCCLKMLEDTPKDSFIFLITTLPNSLLSTIKSRCHKIYDNLLLSDVDIFVGDKTYQDFLSLLEDQNLILKKLSSKFDKAVFEEFSNAVMMYFRDGMKNPDMLSENFLLKYDNVSKIIADTKEFDLDLKSSFILIMEEINQN